MNAATILTQPAFLKKNLGFGIRIAHVVLVAILILSAFLHFYNLSSIGDSNAYYTAAVYSMTQSWRNFFFVAAEPGGSVTVDKPPLGLWIETAFALVLGASGFSTSLPNMLAGILGAALLYHLVSKYTGELAGLVAALVATITPVYLAANRNNTMDETLLFFLLLAAWAFMRAADSGKPFWVLLGGLIVGLGFNIKMSQAFLPLPAFYALYFLASKEGWLRKALNLAAATALTLLVGLSWAIIVDLTPADSRPFVGSSKDNSVISLILEHNGGSRLVGGGPGNAPRPGGQANQPPQANSFGSTPQPPQAGKPPREALQACENQTQGAACSFTLPNGNFIEGNCVVPPNQSQLACAPQGMAPRQPQNQSPQAGRPPQEALDACANLTQGANCSFSALFGAVNGVCVTPPGLNQLACAPQGAIQATGTPRNGGQTPFSAETGEPGLFRFFVAPLSKQMSWLLPFALLSAALALFAARIRLPVEAGAHKALILWGGWLLTCLVFFSAISGIFHAYYVLMLVPPLAAAAGLGFGLLWSWSVDREWTSGFLIGAVVLTLAFQTYAALQYEERSFWLLGAALLFSGGIMLLGFNRRAAYLLILSSVLFVPAYWSWLTVSFSADQNLPSAYGGGDSRMNNIRRDSSLDPSALDMLQAETRNVKYLLAVPSAQQGAEIVLATGRPVLYMGGFSGQDDVVGVEDLQRMVAAGELRYVLYGQGGGRGVKSQIAEWLQTSCVNMIDFAREQPSPQGNASPLFLYRCGD